MRDIATATLTGNLTREVELRPLPSGTEVARLRVASGARRRSGEEWVERTNYFTVEVYGPQASLCAERLGKGSRVVVDGQLDWREWTDQEQNRREAVVLRARQILFERMGPTRLADTDPAERDGSPDDEFGTAAVETSPAGGGRRAVLIRHLMRLARPCANGRAASPRSGLFFCALKVDPARAVDRRSHLTDIAAAPATRRLSMIGCSAPRRAFAPARCSGKDLSSSDGAGAERPRARRLSIPGAQHRPSAICRVASVVWGSRDRRDTRRGSPHLRSIL